jgi:hypothetical protein
VYKENSGRLENDNTELKVMGAAVERPTAGSPIHEIQKVKKREKKIMKKMGRN